MTNRDGSPMIEVRLLETGDTAWAADEAAAVVAGRTLCQDAADHLLTQGSKRTIAFFIDDQLAVGPVPESALWIAV